MLAIVNAKDLSYQDYIDLINGKDVKTHKLKMNVNWNELEIRMIKQSITLRKEL